MTEAIVIAIALYLAGGVMVTMNFMYTWGWGDAGYGNSRVHKGIRGDEWHRRRRFAFYSVVIWASLFNPIAWVILALRGRKIFRRGVYDVDGGITHRRWYGE